MVVANIVAVIELSWPPFVVDRKIKGGRRHTSIRPHPAFGMTMQFHRVKHHHHNPDEPMRPCVGEGEYEGEYKGDEVGEGDQEAEGEGDGWSVWPHGHQRDGEYE